MRNLDFLFKIIYLILILNLIGEKPYSCPHPKCTYAACRKDMITRHLKVHTKNRLSSSFDADRLKPISNTNRLLTLSSVSFENSPTDNMNNNNNTKNMSNNLNLNGSKSSTSINIHNYLPSSSLNKNLNQDNVILNNNNNNNVIKNNSDHMSHSKNVNINNVKSPLFSFKNSNLQS